jgi:hypothetical protein
MVFPEQINATGPDTRSHPVFQSGAGRHRGFLNVEQRRMMRISARFPRRREG